ncbi:hypothetical protein LCGC14_1956570 [marine sediment metagenome]|uniref:Acylneuraminate cytidylyltransferase n=1 Tax=marine sediment metagenome TaxID=412755 RepID=A0A0F9G4A9_9ZZZZ
MKILGIIIMRISSTRLLRKNMLPFAGKTLLEWSLIQATTTIQIDDVVLVTDSQEMGDVAGRYGVEVIIQPQDSPGFGTVGGGGTAINYTREQLGDRLKQYDAIVDGFWNSLMKPGDYDGMIDMYKEEEAASVLCMTRRNESMQILDVGGNHYMNIPVIKHRRQLASVGESIQAVDIYERFRRLSLPEVEALAYFYELERWQGHGGIDYQDQFDVAEVLFKKHILKNGANPYQDYYEAGPV